MAFPGSDGQNVVSDAGSALETRCRAVTWRDCAGGLNLASSESVDSLEAEGGMAWVQRGLIAGIVGLGALMVANRGGDGKGGVAPDRSPLRDAVHAKAIPVWNDAKLRDRTGGNYYDDVGGPVTFTSTSWFFSFSDPVAEVLEFYRKNMPAGTKPIEVDEGEHGLEWIPPGAKEGEDVTVRIREGELQITETVKAPGS